MFDSNAAAVLFHTCLSVLFAALSTKLSVCAQWSTFFSLHFSAINCLIFPLHQYKIYRLRAYTNIHVKFFSFIFCSSFPVVVYVVGSAVHSIFMKKKWLTESVCEYHSSFSFNFGFDCVRQANITQNMLLFVFFTFHGGKCKRANKAIYSRFCQ